MPSNAEWKELLGVVGGWGVAGTTLKSAIDWNYGNGSDVYGFSALPQGSRGEDGSFSLAGYDTGFWSTSKYEKHDNTYLLYLNYSTEKGRIFGLDRNYGLSVRCIKD